MKMGSFTLIIKVIWPSFRLKKLHSTLLLYTDLGRPRGATRPKRALVPIAFGNLHDYPSADDTALKIQLQEWHKFAYIVTKHT